MLVPGFREAPRPFAVLSGRWLFTRHLLAVTITVLAVMAVWAVVTAPFVAVFIIDDTASGYFEAVLRTAGYVSVATLAITPVAAGLERLVLHGSRAWAAIAVLLPIALFAAVVACVVVILKITKSDGASGAVAIAALLMFVLALYWPTLWALHLASHLLRRVHHAQRR